MSSCPYKVCGYWWIGGREILLVSLRLALGSGKCGPCHQAGKNSSHGHMAPHYKISLCHSCRMHVSGKKMFPISYGLELGEGCGEGWLACCQTPLHEILSCAHHNVRAGPQRRAGGQGRLTLSGAPQRQGKWVSLRVCWKQPWCHPGSSPKEIRTSVYMTEFHKYIVILPHISTFRQFKVWQGGSKKG